MKTERLSIRISADLKEQAQAMAEAEGRSLANLIEWLLTRALQERQEKERG